MTFSPTDQGLGGAGSWGVGALSEAEAGLLNSKISTAWTSKDPSNVIRIIDPNAVWRDNDSVFLGRSEIWAALRAQWEHTLHFQTKQELASYESHRIAARFQSEWQDSQHGQWYRRSGYAEFTFDDERLITTIESRTEKRRITAEERRLKLDTAARQSSALND